jgi:ATP-dependent RNA helicase SUPV3L1/SUV3
MGLNMPIKRVVFLETAKFDGKERRLLKQGEIRQIAGRAGRYGIYNEGLVTSEIDRKRIKAALTHESLDITKAVMAFPETLLGIDSSLLEILSQWKKTTCAVWS